MVFFSDESIEAEINSYLRENGHVVHSVSELFPSISDQDVLQYALNEHAVLITNDKDFGDLVTRQAMPHHGIILLRLRKTPGSEKAKIVAEIVDKHGEELISGFTVISQHSIRIRKS